MWKRSSDDSEFKYTVVDDFDHIVDESGNSTINLRKLYWGDNSDNVKLDLRRYYMTEQGERLGKGVSFLTEDGPNNLVDIMAGLGYGNTRNILNGIKDRKDFQKSLNSVLGKESEFYDEDAGELDDDYFDPKSLLG